MANKLMILRRTNVEHDYDPMQMDARIRRSTHKWLLNSIQKKKKKKYVVISN